jgi:hypothetical protein
MIKMGGIKMSTMTLKLPMNYVEIEREEMEYVDGGAVGINDFNSTWWGYQVKLSGDLLKKIFEYSADGIIAAGGGLIAAALGVSSVVAAGIAFAISVDIFIIKAIHDGYHGVSFNYISATKTIVPWRQ